MPSQLQEAPYSPARITLIIFSLAMGGFGIGTGEFAIMGLMPGVAADLGVTEPQVGHLISAYALGVVVGAPFGSGLLAGGDHYMYEKADDEITRTRDRMAAICERHGVDLKAAAMQFPPPIRP